MSQRHMKTCTHCHRVGILGYCVERYGGKRFVVCADDLACAKRTSALLIERHVRETRLARMRAALMERMW